MVLKNNKLYLYITALILLLQLPLSAQKYLSTPYSRLGLGEMQPRNSVAGRMLGGTSYASRENTWVNVQNPASYTAFDSLTSVIDGAFFLHSHTLSEGGVSQRGTTASMDYLYLGLPVINRVWAMGAGIQPFASVNYDYVFEDDMLSRIDRGEGGVYEVFWGNAFQFCPAFSIGVQVSYLFGTSLKTHELSFSDESFLSSRTLDENRMSGFLFNFGLQYEKTFGQKKLGVGMVFSPSLPACCHADSRLYHLNYFKEGIEESVLDTLKWDAAEKTSRRLDVRNPMNIGFGLSLSETDKFWIGADVTWTEWSRFSLGDVSDSLADLLRFSVGGCWIPNALSSHYFMKVNYSLGGFYEKNYICVGEHQMHRMGLDVGFSFPMKKSRSKLGICLEIGTFRTSDGSGIQEQYRRLILQVQLHEKWYQRRRLD